MRTTAILSAAGLITLAIAAALWGDDPAERAQAERIALLVQQLGSDEFAVREAAAKELEELGEPPLAELRKAAAGAENAEVRWRAQKLLAAPSRKSKSTGLELLLIKAGEFQMGSTADEDNRHADETLHKVRISRPFYLGKFEVTQAEYRAVMKTSPSWFAESGGGQAKVAGLDTTRYPVERVSWFDAAAFCNELSRLDGFSPYYKLTNVEPVGESIKYAKVAVLGGYGYRLPSEAEWEFACRAGTATAYHYGGPTNGARANLKGVTSMGGYGGVVVGPNCSGRRSSAATTPTPSACATCTPTSANGVRTGTTRTTTPIRRPSIRPVPTRASGGFARRLVAAERVELPLGKARLAHERRTQGLPGLSHRPQSVNASSCLRKWRPLAATAAALWLLAGCTGNKPLPAPPPWTPKPLDVSQLPLQYPDCNIVLVSFDALQAAHVGCLGYSRDVTPGIDALARESFTFTHNYSVSSWTVPASMSWFTGVYPSEHRMTNKFAVYNPQRQQPANLRELSPELVTLAEVLQQNGYATGGFTGNAGVSGGFGFAPGFDEYVHEKQRFGSLDTSITKAIAWVQKNRDHKFFLFLHGYDVHGQCLPPGGLDYRFVEPGYDRKFTGSEQEQELLREEGLDKGQLTLREADVRFWRAIYDEKIQRADEKFQRFLAEFERLGLMGKTLFVLTSDHGTEFYEHRRFDHGFTLYDELIHVPLFIKLPGQRGGAVLSERVSSIDIMPTIFDLAGAEVPENVQRQLRGRSLAPVMRGEPSSRDVFSETDYRQYTYKRAIIAPDGWKLIFTLENRSRELYDLRSDPGELQNRIAEFPQLAAELENRLIAHYRAIGRDFTAEQWEIGLNPVYDSQAKPPK